MCLIIIYWYLIQSFIVLHSIIVINYGGRDSDIGNINNYNVI